MNTFRGITIILGFRYEITETETFGNDASLNEDGVGGYECAGSLLMMFVLLVNPHHQT